MQQSSHEPSLEEIDAFLQVAERGGFTVAARRGGLPKSTLSRRPGSSGKLSYLGR